MRKRQWDAFHIPSKKEESPTMPVRVEIRMGRKGHEWQMKRGPTDT